VSSSTNSQDADALRPGEDMIYFNESRPRYICFRIQIATSGIPCRSIRVDRRLHMDYIVV
jgi:hypothetical protein